jgi:hypothetical protein
MKRDIVFLVADKNMEEVFSGFLSRNQFHLSLGCDAFTFDAEVDIHRHPRKDPGVYNEAAAFLETYRDSHHCAVVVLDSEWEGSPGAAKIREKIEAELATKWQRYVVIVIDPELEQWVWVSRKVADNTFEIHPHVVNCFRYKQEKPLHELLRDKNNWDNLKAKPKRPKEAVELVLKQSRMPRSSAIYRTISEQVSIKGCKDDSFKILVEKLREWFVMGDQL